MNIIINPGTGPVPEATEEHAAASMLAFGEDLRHTGLDVKDFSRTPDADYGEGRFAFTLNMADGRTVEVQMPGLPLDRVRYTGADGQNIWDFPRLYIDGSSWVWKFALTVCEPDEENN